MTPFGGKTDANKTAGTVVVCSYDRPSLLGGALESLAAQEWDGPGSFEILVVDDGPDRETMEKAAEWGARYVQARGDGIAQARNLGVREARGEWVAFFDDDQRASSRWLAELVRVSKEKDALVVAGSRRLVPLEEGLSLPSHARLRSYLGEEEWGEEPRPLGPEELPNTGNVLIRTEVFERVGLFDPAFIEGGEDTDFFTRVRMKGITLWASPGAAAVHLVGPGKLHPAWWRRRALRGGAAEARIRRKRLGRRALLSGLFYWSFMGMGSFLLLARALLTGKGEEALYRAFLFRHFLGYARQVPGFLWSGSGGEVLGAPSFRNKKGES